MNLSQITYDTRQRLASENPSGRLPCCWQQGDEGCVDDATHWLLSTRLGAWQVVETLPAEAPPCPPVFCAPHAARVAEQRNAARPSPVPWGAPKPVQGTAKEKKS
jgi:hypothetical protein